VTEVFYHEPVLLNEAVRLLLHPSFEGGKGGEAKFYVDCTLGGGGYTRYIIENTSKAVKVFAIDRDENSIKHCKEVLNDYADRIIYVNDNFANISKVLINFTPQSTLKGGQVGVVRISGAVLDLGLSTYQLEHEAGFSYQKDTELDMRTGKDAELKAKDVLNTYAEKELLRIFKEYGELKYSRQITKSVIIFRKKKKFERTMELVELLGQKIPPRYFNKDMSKIFQALRIEVNDELVNLKKVLSGLTKYVDVGGRIVCVSYHSLEDRIVKNFFRAAPCFKVITKKPVMPSREEISRNVRARSAKLRAAEKIK
jgi:16S rRNA (cytosine1402-N4)-methyltransferase